MKPRPVTRKWGQIVDDGMFNEHFIPFRFQGQYADEELSGKLYYNRYRYYSPELGQYITQDPIGLDGGNPTLYGYVFDPNNEIDPLGLENIQSGDFNQAMNEALRWLEQRGFRAERVTPGRFLDGRPIGMQTVNGKVGFRVEFDARSGAHINVWSGKEKGPHIQFNASERTVTKIQGRYKCRG